MVKPRFVDCHSHVVPSGDDGASSIEQGLELCDLAAQAGTAILFATPHVWPHFPLSEERELAVRRDFARLRERAPLDLRLGFELTPAPPLLREDPARYVLEGTRHVLIEVPFVGPPGELLALAQHVEDAGLVPLIAHPERTEAVREQPELAHQLAERWPLQVNATSIFGRHGSEAEELAWRLIESPATSPWSPRTGTASRGRRGSTTPTSSSGPEWGRKQRCRSSTAQHWDSVRDRLHLAQPCETLERLRLDLTHALAREPEAAADVF